MEQVLYNIAAEVCDWLRENRKDLDTKSPVPTTSPDVPASEDSGCDSDDELDTIKAATEKAASFQLKHDEKLHAQNLDAESDDIDDGISIAKGGRWELVIGLVGKPSAG